MMEQEEQEHPSTMTVTTTTTMGVTTAMKGEMGLAHHDLQERQVHHSHQRAQ